MKQSRTELLEHLTEQRDWLNASAERYDTGHKHEAKRLASTVRTLLHDSGSSHSLLKQLGVKGGLQYLDSANGNHAHTIFSFAIVTMGFEDHQTFYPRLQPITRTLPFEPWWSNVVLKSGSLTLTRRAMTLYLANQDGGSHVDPNLRSGYYAISRTNGLGLEIHLDGELHTDANTNPIPAAMRQIAFELASTMDAQLQNLIG